MLVDPFDPIVEIGFVVAVKIGDVDFEPTKASSAERFGFAECEKATAEIIADMVEMCWDWVGTTAEIEVMREIERIVQELRRSHQSTQYNGAGKQLTARAISSL